MGRGKLSISAFSKKIDTILPGIFYYKQESGNDCLYFNDSSISQEPFFIFNLEYVSNDDSIRLSIYPLNKTNRFMSIQIYLSKNKIDSWGFLTMNSDFMLTDQACISLYELNIDVRYIDQDFVYYDRDKIMRKHTINTIVNE